MIHIISSSSSNTLQTTGTWCLSNLCRGTPPPSFEFAKKIIPLLLSILKNTNFSDQMKGDACWALAYLSGSGRQHIQFLLDHELSSYILLLLNDYHTKTRIIAPTIRIIGNITFGDDHQAQRISNCSIISSLLHILKSSHSENILRELCWALSNIAAGTQNQIELLLNSSIVEDIIFVRSNHTPIPVLKEMAWIITNIVSCGNINYIATIVHRGAIQFISDLLSIQDHALLMILIEALEYIFTAGFKLSETNSGNPFLSILEESGGLSLLQNIADNGNPSLSNQVSTFLERIIPKDDMEEEYLIPPINNLTNEFVFGTI